MIQQLIFENVRKIVEGLGTPDEDHSRILDRIPDSEELAVARRQSGEYEIFFLGEKIKPKLQSINNNLKFDRWQIEKKGEYFFANSLIFPHDDEFIAIASLIIVEFARLDSNLTLQEKFDLIEPLLNVFLTKQVLNEAEAMGLLGELYFLKKLLCESSPSEFEFVLGGWQGYGHNSRDFKFHDVSVEIKTTRSSESNHEINSINQIEVFHDSTGNPIEKLYLLSLGFIKAEGESIQTSISLKSTYEDIINILSMHTFKSSELSAQFGDMVKCYGISQKRYYDHSEMQNTSVAINPWNITFNRIYDMDDDNILLPNKNKLSEFLHTPLESYKFTIKLPRRVTGDINPLNELNVFAKKIVMNIVSINQHDD